MISVSYIDLNMCEHYPKQRWIDLRQNPLTDTFYSVNDPSEIDYANGEFV